MKNLYLGFCILFLIYLIWPGPSKISDFKDLPNSVKSKLDGDVWQVPNVAGYFSNNYRDFTVTYYLKLYKGMVKLPFLPIRLNYPPEFAFKAIKVQTDSTYLEELVYPMRDSLFVNGMEPFYPDGQSKYWGSTKFSADGKEWDTKATIRYYQSSLWARFIVWLGVCISILMTYKLGRRII